MRGGDFFSEKKGGEDFFSEKKGSEDFFFEEGGEEIFSEKKIEGRRKYIPDFKKTIYQAKKLTLLGQIT